MPLFWHIHDQLGVKVTSWPRNEEGLLLLKAAFATRGSRHHQQDLHYTMCCLLILVPGHVYKSLAGETAARQEWSPLGWACFQSQHLDAADVLQLTLSAVQFCRPTDDMPTAIPAKSARLHVQLHIYVRNLEVSSSCSVFAVSVCHHLASQSLLVHEVTLAGVPVWWCTWSANRLSLVGSLLLSFCHCNEVV